MAQMEPHGDAYGGIVASAYRVLRRKEQALERVTTGAVILVVVLLGAWYWDHGRQEDRYEKALSTWCKFWDSNPTLCEIP